MRTPRADHLGSFLRPQELLEARRTLPRDSAQLREIEDRNILRVLAKQKELGFEVFTDGEFRRENFMSDLMDAVEGFDMGDEVARSWRSSSTATTAQARSVPGVVISRLRQVRPLTARELPFLQANSPGRIKMTLPSATQFPAIAFKRGVSDGAYRSPSEFLWDVVEIIKAELHRLAEQGVGYIQIDAPRYSYYLDPKWREWLRQEMGQEPDSALDEAVQADNACLEAARRPGVTLAIHLCRGNNRSQWYAQGGYDPIAEKHFGTLNVDRFLLEYDDERSGGFEPLRFVPRGKTVVLGLISTKRPQLESPTDLARRIDQAARYVPLENLAISPQCGFASTLEGNLLSEEDQWAKLRLVVETARQVWGN